MERSIRIGKDFNVRWSINKRVDGERQPYELAGKELVLQYRTPYGLKEATEWKTEGNIIVWTFRGKEQKDLGLHGLILTENGGKDGMVTVDTCRAFKLVAHSCEETEGSGGDIVIEDVVLESEVAFAPLTIQKDSLFVAKAGETTYEEIAEAYEQGKLCICLRSDGYYGYLSTLTSQDVLFVGAGKDSYSNYIAKCHILHGWSYQAAECESKLNRTFTISESSTDTKYPTAKAVYDALQQVYNKISLLEERIENIENTLKPSEGASVIGTGKVGTFIIS